ncbi:MAG: type II toxin-antitoxin system VapC family toxin [Candidatus Sumerlaeota bacterium]|nr:type II toxin-antitoxin system VapC family toxin [Candidatus Sumerlaeota bacterium]
MEKLVVDSSIAIKWFVSEPNTAEARRILESYQKGAIRLLAPDLIYSEVGNIVWKKWRIQQLSETDALDIITEFSRLGLETTPSSLLLRNAYYWATNCQRTVYDSMYVALSAQEQCPFVTADEKLYNAIREAYHDIFLAGNLVIPSN